MGNIFKKLTGVLPIGIAEVGDHVQFGAFAWRVIAIENGKKLLLSKDCMQMDMEWELRDEDSNASIEDMLADILAESTLDYAEEYNGFKEYFKEWFCQKYFSEEDMAKIIPHNADEFVFLLSKEEVEKYIPKKEDRIASMETIINPVTRPWLLRVDGYTDYEVAVCSDGEIERVPEGQLCDKFRPAVWIK